MKPKLSIKIKIEMPVIYVINIVNYMLKKRKKKLSFDGLYNLFS